MKSKTIKLFLFTFLMCLGSVGAWAEEYYNSILYYQNFEDATNYNLGWTCAGSIAQSDISGNKVLDLIQGGGSGNRAVTGNLTTMSSDFSTVTDYSFEFDMGIATSNTNVSTLSLNSLNGVLFTINNPSYSTTSTIVAADGTTVIATITHDGYLKACPKTFNHFKIESNDISGTFLTITNAVGNVVLDKTKLADGLSVLTTFSGSLGRAQPHFAFDNLILRQHVDGAVKPYVELKKVNGAARTYSISFVEGETLHYKLPGSDEYLTTPETPCEVTVDESGILYAYTTKGTATSEVVETIVDATEIVLPTPEIRVGITQDGNKFIPSFGAVCDNSSVLLNPEITISATLDGVDVTSAVVAGNYTPANSGTLTVTATAEGYTSSASNMFVAAEYTRSWQSVDFSTITIDNVAEYFGDGWSQSANTGRWSSWAEQTYSYIEYKTNEGNNITINDRIRMRDVVSVNVGYGLGRNVSGNEQIRVLDVKANEIAEFKIYNGYGKRTVAEGSYLSCVVGDGGEVSMNSNNGALLVQTSVYSAMIDYTINYLYKGEVVYSSKGKALKGTIITAEETISVGEDNKYKIISDQIPALTIVEGENVLTVDVEPLSQVITYYRQDYEGDGVIVDWTTATAGRFTPVLLTETVNEKVNTYLSVDQGARQNNGTTLKSKSLVGKVASGTDFTMTFDMKISSSTDQTPTSFTIYDAANSSAVFSLTATGAWATSWIVNGNDNNIVTLDGTNKGNSKQTIADCPWYTFKLTRIGNLTYLTITSKTSGVEVFERTEVSTISTTGGLGNMDFVTKRYFANFAIDNIVVRSVKGSDIPEIHIPLTLTSAGVGTICSPYNLDFTNAEKIAVYKAETSEGRINLTRVYNVAAREGVLIRSLDGKGVTEDIPVSATAFDANEGNEFIGTLVDIASQPSEDEEYRYYILSSKTVNGNKVYGFYLANKQKIGAGKAYLRVPLAAAAKYSFFSFDDETTGVEDIELGTTETDSPVYDLFGRKVVNPATGLYIKNGKKFIVK